MSSLSRLVLLSSALVAGCGSSLEPTTASGGPEARTDAGPTDPADPADAADALPGCAAALEPAAVDLLFLVDRSASWSRKADRWQGLRDAVDAFVAAHPDQALAATSFPRLLAGAERCDLTDYEEPEHAWATSPDAIRGWLAGLTFEGGSALAPALAGAAKHARAHAAAHRDRVTSIVLLTDATPMDDEVCGSGDWPHVASIAGAAFDRGLGASVRVDVVSVIGKAVSDDHFARLGALAAEGGGYMGLVNGGREDVAKSARDALETMRDRHRTCAWALPAGTDPITLTLTFEGGAVETATRVEDASACTSGAQFWVDDPAAPKRAFLCGGEGGIGGFCEQTMLRARATGAPTVAPSCD